MEQTLGSLFKIASEFGLSISILVGFVFYFIKKEKDVTQKLITTIDGLKGVIENNSRATERIEVIAEEIKAQGTKHISAIELHNQSLKILSDQLELLKKIDTQDYNFQFGQVNTKLDNIAQKIERNNTQ